MNGLFKNEQDFINRAETISLKKNSLNEVNDKQKITKKDKQYYLSKIIFIIFTSILLILSLKKKPLHKNMKHKTYIEYYNDIKYYNNSDLNISYFNDTINATSHIDKNETVDIKLETNESMGNKKSNKKRIGVVGLANNVNIGNNLVKYGMYMKLKEFGLEPVIIAKNKPNSNSYFIEKYTKFKEIKYSYSELKEQDYDFIMVNSDQTWSYSDYGNLFNYGLLEFAKDWSIPKFIYGASFGKELWIMERSKQERAKNLLKDFTGISFREIGTVRLVEKYLDMKANLVIDPSFLIDKSYYLNLIKDYKPNFNFNEKYLFVYQFAQNEKITKLINDLKINYNYKIYNISLENIDQKYYVEKFIFGINVSQAVVTDSYHATLFSIMFNKPFLTYINAPKGKLRFESLRECFKLDERIIENGQEINRNLLFEPLNINWTYVNELKNFSINYLKKNVGVE